MVGDRDVTIRSVLWMILFSLIAAIFSIANSWYAVQFGERTAHAVRMYLYRKIQTFSFGNLDQFPTSDLLVNMTSDVNLIKTAVQQVILILAQSPVLFLGSLYLIYTNSPQLTWIMWVVVIVIIFIMFIALRRIGVLFENRQAKLDGSTVFCRKTCQAFV